jgi:hypothetical protein
MHAAAAAEEGAQALADGPALYRPPERLKNGHEASLRVDIKSVNSFSFFPRRVDFRCAAICNP